MIVSLFILRDGPNFSFISIIRVFIHGPKHHHGGLYVSCNDAHLSIILLIRVSLGLKSNGIVQNSVESEISGVPWYLYDGEANA